MFTGIVSGRGEVVDIKKNSSTIKARIVSSLMCFDKIKVGDSIAVNGVCLTVVECRCVDSFSFWVDIISETQKITNLRFLKIGSKINLEPPLCWGGEISGHLLSGHVSTTAVISNYKFSDCDNEVVFSIDKSWKKYLFKKAILQ